MNKWLERALVSAAASVVTTTAIVTTAERPHKRKKSKKKKKAKDGPGKDGVRVQEEVPRSIGAQAAHDYRSGHDGGLTPAEWLENMKSAGKKVGSVGGYLLGRGKNKPPPPRPEGEEAAAAPRLPRAGRKKVRRKVRRKKGTGPPVEAQQEGRSAHQGEPVSELKELRDAAFKKVSSAAARRAAEKVGVAGAMDSLKESELWKKTGAFGRRVKERFPEDLEKVGGTLSDNAKRLSERVKKAASERPEEHEAAKAPPSAHNGEAGQESAETQEGPETDEKDLGARLERGVKGFASWAEGPGAPGYGARSKRVRPSTDGGDDVVEAKDPGEEPPEVVEAKDPPEDAGR